MTLVKGILAWVIGLAFIVCLALLYDRVERIDFIFIVFVIVFSGRFGYVKGQVSAYNRVHKMIQESKDKANEGMSVLD